MRRGKKGNQTFLFVTISLGLLSALLTLFLYIWSPRSPRFLREVDLRYSDFRFKKLRGIVKPGPDVVIVAIDEKSVNELGRWPWSRKHIAELLEKLTDYGAKVVSFDVIFSEPESEDADGMLSLSIKRAKNIILGYYFRPTSTQEPSSESLNHVNRSSIKLIKFIENFKLNRHSLRSLRGTLSYVEGEEESYIKCHSEPCPESKLRSGEESQTDRFARICGIPDRVGDQEGG